MTEQTKEQILAALPPLPMHPEPRSFAWSKLEEAAIAGYGKACALGALSHPKSNLADSDVIAAPVDHVNAAVEMVAGAHPDKGTSALPFPARIMDQIQDMARREDTEHYGSWTDGDGAPLQDDADAAIAWIKAAAATSSAIAIKTSAPEILDNSFDAAPKQGSWHWVRYDALNGWTDWAPAMLRGKAWYSYQFSGIPCREVEVGPALVYAAPVVPASGALERAHELGFLRCAGWAQRDDLFSDVTSQAYRKDRSHDLATITTPPQAAPVAQLSEPPEGWKLVPIEPTEEMVDAACDIDARGIALAANIKRYAEAGLNGGDYVTTGQIFAEEYKAALAAAPTTPKDAS